MKHTAIIANAAIFTIIFLLGSCSTTPQPKPVSVDLSSPKYTMGTAEVQLEGFFSFGRLRKHNFNISYYPDDDVVCLEYRIDFVNHFLFLDSAGRGAFINALYKYKDDYEQRNLVSGKRATRRAYGKTPGLLIWGAFQIAGQGRSHPLLELGYSFKEKAPYFTLTMPEAENVSEVTGDKTRTSNTQFFYFTRAQADALTDMFEPENINNFRRSMGIENKSTDITPDIW